MFQDIAPHCYHNEYVPAPPDEDSVLLLYQGREIWMKEQENGEIVFPLWGEIKEVCENVGNSAADTEIFPYTYAFTIDATKFFLVHAEHVKKIPDAFQPVPIRALRRRKPQHLAFAAVTGCQLFNWYQSHHFCGRCGGHMRHDTKERMLYCETCHSMEYPKISPAVIVGVTKKNQILLTKYAGREYTNYALVAGFAEIGETIEETVRREVMEEVGLKVHHLKYYKSQPWSFSDTLLFGFYCEAEEAPIHLQEDELSLAEWVDRENVPADGTDISLTHEMMWMFKQGKNP
ncbi:MAG: NAD(+) diphosphatase [bacterium]|nr:NAD(+) diphosphatase [bacterium]